MSINIYIMKIFLFVLSLLPFTLSDFHEYHFGKQKNINELGETTFYKISDFKISKGQIYLTDTQVLKVYVFDSSGNLINSSGRQGRGPGEFVYGPRWLAPVKEKVYVVGTMPYFFVYDKQLNFVTNKRIEINPISTSGLKYFNEKLYLITTQFFKEDLIIYDPADESIRRVNLNFKIEPGMLSNRALLRLDNYWLFAWEFQNKFKVYDNSFNKIDSFRIIGIQEKAEGRIVKSGFIPDEATAYRAKMYKAGAFYPSGTFFTSFVVLDEEHFMVQLGTLTGGSNKALILDIEGNVKQSITLPQKRSRILGYSNETLYMVSRDSGTISAYKFYI